MSNREHLQGTRAEAERKDGIGAALRTAHAVTDEGDERLRTLLDKLRHIKGRGDS